MEKQFYNTPQAKRPSFDFISQLFVSLHQRDEFYQPDNETKEMIYSKRMKEFEKLLKFRKKYLGTVIKIAEKWNVQLMDEEHIPHEKITILKCEDNRGKGTNIFIDFKKRKFFESMSKNKKFMEDRLDVVKESLDMIKDHHKQLVDVLTNKMSLSQVLLTPDFKEMALDPEVDSRHGMPVKEEDYWEELNTRVNRTALSFFN